MNTTQLNTFLICAEESSFTAAARRLFVSPSALYQQIDKLEKDLGFTLFTRNHNGISLTDAGKEFHYAARQSMLLIMQARRNGQAAAKGAKILRVAFYSAFYADALRRFETEHPEILVRHVGIPDDDLDDILEKIKDRHLHLCEGEYVKELDERGFAFHEDVRIQTRLCAVVSYRNPLARRSAVTLEELAGENTLFYKSLFTAGERIPSEILRTFRIINTRFSSIEVMNAIEDGKVYIMEESYVGRLCPFGQAIPITPDIIMPYGFIYQPEDEMAQLFLRYI